MDDGGSLGAGHLCVYRSVKTQPVHLSSMLTILTGAGN